MVGFKGQGSLGEHPSEPSKGYLNNTVGKRKHEKHWSRKWFTQLSEPVFHVEKNHQKNALLPGQVRLRGHWSRPAPGRSEELLLNNVFFCFFLGISRVFLGISCFSRYFSRDFWGFQGFFKDFQGFSLVLRTQWVTFGPFEPDSLALLGHFGLNYFFQCSGKQIQVIVGICWWVQIIFYN